MNKSQNTLRWASVLATVSTVVLLSACGSGGSGSGVSAPAPTPKPNTTSSTSTNPSTTTPATPSNPQTSSYTFQGVKVAEGTSAGLAVADSSGKYTYNYNGSVVDITYKGISAGQIINLDVGDVNQVVGGSTYSYSRFGAMAPKGHAEKGEVFYMGQLTANMPTTGTAVYKGLAVDRWVTDTGVKIFNSSPVMFNVDFAKKTLSGSTEGNIYMFEAAPISGNHFAGNLKYGQFITGNYAGSFFGPNAEELGGIGQFKPDADGNDAGAFSFGARKQ